MFHYLKLVKNQLEQLSKINFIKKIMKKNIALLAFTCVSIIMIFGIYTPKATSNSNGAPSGFANNPSGNGTKTCTNCHNEAITPFPAGSGFKITKNGLPVTSYIPDSTYDVSFSIILNVGNKQTGFEATTENSAGFIGTNNTPGPGAKLIGAATYITQTTPKTGNNPTWTYKWTAPGANNNIVTFYGSLRVDNLGIYTTSLDLTEEVSSTAVANIFNSTVSLYPNPSNGAVTINNTGKPMNVSIFKFNGATVKTVLVNKTETINLNTGIYLFSINNDNQQYSKKVIIN
jgi:hypothetical protein